MSLISKWLEDHLVQNNNIINLSGEKNCMEKVPCWFEHLSMVWCVLKEARFKKTSAASIWLDTANAYGSVPHNLISFALQRYGIPNQGIEIVELYYAAVFSKYFSESAIFHNFHHFVPSMYECNFKIFYIQMFLSLYLMIIQCG